MVKTTFEDARNWLNEISSKDSVLIIHDGDTDGFSSGVIFYKFCKKRNAKVSHKALIRNFVKLKDINLRKSNKIIFTDIAWNIIEDEKELLSKKEVLFVDHHVTDKIIPKPIKEYIAPKNKYLPCARLSYELTKESPWLSLAGTLADAGDLYSENEEFLNNLTKRLSTNNEEFRNEVSNKINDLILYFEEKDNVDKAFDILESLNGPKDIEKIEKYSIPVQEEFEKCKKEFFEKKEDLNGINFYYFNPKYNIKGALATTLTIKGKTGPVVFATPASNEMLGISFRDNERKLNVLNVLKASIKDLNGASGGGHPFAAGAKIRKEDLEKFKENIKDYLEELGS